MIAYYAHQFKKHVGNVWQQGDPRELEIRACSIWAVEVNRETQV